MGKGMKSVNDRMRTRVMLKSGLFASCAGACFGTRDITESVSTEIPFISLGIT